MKGQQRCEYLVVGTGAGGSVAGALLAEAGHDVLFLEEGERHIPSPTTIGEGMHRLYRNGGIFPFLGAPMIPFAEGCCVGGGTVINGALLWRTPPWVLEEWQRAGLVGYDSAHLQPHFEAVERDLHVQTHTLEHNANRDSLALYRGANALGWKVAMAPRAVKHCTNINLCPVDCAPCGKQSMLENYLPRAFAHGARLRANCRAVKIVSRNGRARQLIARVGAGGTESSLTIEFDHLVLACGAIQTPHLLQRSGITRRAGYPVQFHMNLKTVAVFPEAVRAYEGTIFTVQVQEFAREGIVMMAMNLSPHFLALSLARHGIAAVNDGLKHYMNAAVFTTMVRSKSRAHVLSTLGDAPLVWYRFHPEDLPKIKFAIRQTAEVLFKSGASELYLPIRGSASVHSLDAVDRMLPQLKSKSLDLSTVHVMASCPMGSSEAVSVVRPDGRLWNTQNIMVADASILPSNIGESPQGTIMAFVHELIGRHIAGS